MISMRKRYKVYIVFAIILVSIYFGLTRSNLLDVVKSGRNDLVDLSPVNKDFDLLPNYTKYSFSIDAGAGPETLHQLDDILYTTYEVESEQADSEATTVETFSPVVKKKYNVSPEVVAYTVIVPGAVKATVLGSIKALPGYQDFEVAIDEVPFTINVKQQIANQEMNIEDLRSKLSDSRFFNSSLEIYDEIDQRQYIIDSLRFEEDRYTQRKENPALKIIVKNVGGAHVSVAKQVVDFFKNFVISFVGLTLLMFLVYMALAIILRLMSYLGIRTAKSSGSGYGGYYKYNSRYGSYGGRYGSYGRRRKVKRVYKNREEGEGGEPAEPKD